MRTYTHAVLSYELSRRIAGRRAATWACTGAVLPDIPALTGSAWLLLGSRRLSRDSFYGEVCGRQRFGLPDATLHSAAVLAVSSVILLAPRFTGRSAPERARVEAFLLGWAGHVLADLATHGSDARPPLWPLLSRRFESPVSYRERDRHGIAFTLAEHGALGAVLCAAWRRRS